VENEEVLQALQRFNGLKAQGYHYGRPVDAAAVTAELGQLQLLLEPPTHAEPPEVTESHGLRASNG
jgi:hypothetical protein